MENNPDKNISWKRFFFIIALIAIPVISGIYAKVPGAKNNIEAGISNNLPENRGLIVRSIDTQIVSKHWEDVSAVNISEEVLAIKNLDANYIAISTPYDRPETLKIWADEIHKAGLNVWFRSHWLDWEGDDSHPSVMTTEEYLAKTSDFVRSNPVLFREGDAFTVCVEPEQVFTVRKTGFDSKIYNKFIQDQIDTANAAFAEIMLDGKVHTNWISVNGWIVSNALTLDTVKKMGVITVDHYPDQNSDLTPEAMAETLVNDLNLFHERWQVPIILGEWGYNIETEVSDPVQSEYIDTTLGKISGLPYLIGFNYWAHMGNSSRLINDTKGTNLIYRPAALILQKFYAQKAADQSLGQ